MSVQGLMTVPAGERDAQWLAYALQEAVQLEWATIPPYLCAYWSIKSGPGAARIKGTLRDILIQEMSHMGLACNMLAGIGGTPNIYAENFTPKYPGELPGHVHEGLVVGLAGLSRDEPGNKEQVWKFMQIELPEYPLAERKRVGFATIGEFYDALRQAFADVNPAFSSDRQLTTTPPALMPDLVVIPTVAEARARIDLIKRQGEGTSSSPFVDGRKLAIAPARELAHYYRFGEIHAERELRADPSAPTGWSFTGTPVPFPGANDLYLMAEVPPGGYPESADFDREYTAMLKLLHDAWAVGDNDKLDKAIKSMDNDLSAAAVALLNAGYAAGVGQGIKGPDFRFLPDHRG